MATFLIRRVVHPVKASKTLYRHLTSAAKFTATANQTTQEAASASSFNFSHDGDNKIHINPPGTQATPSFSPSDDVWSMPPPRKDMVRLGPRFYKHVTTRETEDGTGWIVMLDHRTLGYRVLVPPHRKLKLPTLGLAKAIAAEWEYQQIDGIRPFTMPLMNLACLALATVPLNRPRIIERLVNKFNEDEVFFRQPGDCDTKSIAHRIHEKQVQKIDPLLDWVNAEFGFKPVLGSLVSKVNQEDGLIKVVEDLLKKTSDWELGAIDALATAGNSLVIAIAVFHGRLQIEEAIELIRIDEDSRLEKHEFIVGFHDVDIADLRVRISSAVAFLGLSRTT